MIRSVLILLSSFVFYSFSTSAQNTVRIPPDECCRSLYHGAWDTLNLNRLGKEYKRLKVLECSDCRHFDSDLMLVMEILGKRLDGSRKGKVRKVMGKPDEKEGRQQIYHWRDRHDYLYFTKEKHSRKVKHGWYYAFE